MKLTGARLKAFLDRPDPAITAVLVFGPDRGLVQERAERLTVAVAGSAADPFAVAEVAAEPLRADPVRLADEALAFAPGGGRRVVRVRDAADAAAQAVRNLLAQAKPGVALVVLDAGDLPKRSSLRQLFEAEAATVAMGCYTDDAGTLRGLIEETLAAEGLRPTRGALDYLVSHLGADRGVTRNELEKLVVFAGGPGEIGLDAVTAVIDDSHAASIDAIVYAVGDGNAPALDRGCTLAIAAGVSAIALLRAVGQHLRRVLTARAGIAAGRAPRQAMASLRPPILFWRQEAFLKQLDRWSEPRIARAIALLLEAEMECKTTGAPQEALCVRALLRIAQAARTADALSR